MEGMQRHVLNVESYYKKKLLMFKSTAFFIIIYLEGDKFLHNENLWFIKATLEISSV